MSARKLLATILLCLASACLVAAPTLNPSHPDRYVVVEGDTLWDIAGKFLRDPWRWPDVWHVNPQVKNPHLIYPGDVLSLTYDENGNPIIVSKRGRPTVKLSPNIRSSRLDRAIPTIPLNVIRPFLSRPMAVSENELADAAYVVRSAGEHVVAGAGDKVYVRGIKQKNKSKFSLFRLGGPYKSPDAGEDGEILGYEAIFVGEGTAEAFGDKENEASTLLLTSTEREARTGDRVLPLGDDQFNENFLPHAAPADLNGSIISVIDGVSQIGQHQIVVIDKGARENIDVGTVMTVYRRGEIIQDSISGKTDDPVVLPDERAGTVLIFRASEKVSFGLVMEATRAMNLFDAVRRPPEL